LQRKPPGYGMEIFSAEWKQGRAWNSLTFIPLP